MGTEHYSVLAKEFMHSLPFIYIKIVLTDIHTVELETKHELNFERFVRMEKT